MGDSKKMEDVRITIMRRFASTDKNSLKDACRVCFSVPIHVRYSLDEIREWAGVEILPDERFSTGFCEMCASALNFCMFFRSCYKVSETLLRTVDIKQELYDPIEEEIEIENHDVKVKTENVPLEIVPKTESSGSPKIEEKYRTQKQRHPCPSCDRAFEKKSALKRHSIVHTGEKPFRCDTCGKGFSRKSNLLAHITTNSHRKVLKCPVCDEISTTRAALAAHLKKSHAEYSRLKPHACPSCDKRFFRTTSLKRHSRVHTGERPFVCELCSRAFADATCLKFHMRMHAGERAYVCELCGKACSRSGDLSRHMRTHTGERPFACDVCGQSFAYKQALEKHVRVHASERSQEDCDKNFAGEIKKKKHKEKARADEKAFACGVCGQNFTCRVKTMRHMKKVHAGEVS